MRKSSLVTGQQLTGANKQEALQQLAHAAATTLNLDEIEVKATLMTREALADTALISGIAIPHIIIDKEFTPRICVASSPVPWKIGIAWMELKCIFYWLSLFPSEPWCTSKR